MANTSWANDPDLVSKAPELSLEAPMIGHHLTLKSKESRYARHSNFVVWLAEKLQTCWWRSLPARYLP